MLNSLIFFPSDELRQTCSDVCDFGPSLHECISNMLEIMRANKGIGIAAPQIGVQKRIIILSQESMNDDYQVIINPKIRWMSDKKEIDKEGCLSIPDVNVSVERSEEISIEYHDITGQTRYSIFNKILARVVQHEIDHLNGILMIDHATPVKHTMALKNLSKIK